MDYGGPQVLCAGKQFAKVLCNRHNLSAAKPATSPQVLNLRTALCNRALVVLVHGSHVPETRVKVRVPAGRTFMQDRVKRNRGPNLPGVVHHKLWWTTTARAGPPHACSRWTLSSGRSSCSGSGWACGPSRRWHTELPGTGIRTGHVRSASCRVPWGSACGLA